MVDFVEFSSWFRLIRGKRFLDATGSGKHIGENIVVAFDVFDAEIVSGQAFLPTGDFGVFDVSPIDVGQTFVVGQNSKRASS